LTGQEKELLVKITDVEAIHLTLPERQSIADGTQDAIIIRVHTDEGIAGIGEVDSSPHVIKAVIEAPMSHSLCYGLKGVLIGEDPLDVEPLWEKMYRASIFYGRRGAAIQAMSGVDIALWDIVGKASGKPIYKLLGGGYRTEIRAYGSTLFEDTPEGMAKSVARHREQGFTAVKFGWGIFGKDPKHDERLVAAARKEAGDDMDILVDAGLVFNAATAIRTARMLESYNVFWFEEPLPPDDYDGYARLADAVDIPIAAGEEESTRYGFADLMDRGRIDVVQPDVTRAGGISESKKIAAMAHRRNLPCVPHAWSTGIIVAASLQLIAAIPNALFLEYCTWDSPLRWELVDEQFPLHDGRVAIPDKPGLGIELNEEIIERYRVA